VDLQARILGHEGNARARMGEGQQGVDLVRAGLAMALERGLAGPAAEIYQRLADALEHAGDYSAAGATCDEAYSFCSANGLEPTAVHLSNAWSPSVAQQPPSPLLGGVMRPWNSLSPRTGLLDGSLRSHWPTSSRRRSAH
jgi:hypothetical protein